MSSGWIKLHRSMFDNELWTAEPFTKGQAWIDLIGNANHKPGSTWIRGIEIHVKRGQIAWSELTMSKRWKWSRGKVRRYLGVLQNKGMAVQQTNKLTTILTICNYDVYQSDETTDSTTGRTTDSTTDGQQTDNRRYTNKNDKKEKNDKKVVTDTSGDSSPNDAVREVFDYWRQVMGKNNLTKLTKERRNKIQTRLKEGYNVDQIKQAIDGCAQSPFHMGKNDAGTLHDDLELICRNGSKLEWFATSVGAKDPVQRGGPETIDDFAERNRRQAERVMASGMLDDLPPERG